MTARRATPSGMDALDQSRASSEGIHVERRIALIWVLLFFNGLPFLYASVVPLPAQLGQLINATALILAFVLALQLNPRMVIRPSLVLALASLLVVTALITGVRGTAGLGGMIRSLRLGVFVLTLWLLTPWWGRRDLLLAKCHFWTMVGILATVLAGVVIAPGMALGGRLKGVLWPIPPPQVAAFAALVTGMALVGWMSGWVSRRWGRRLAVVGTVLVLLTHTRTAFIGLLVGLIVALASLFMSHRRVRRATIGVAIVGPIVALALAPAFISWFTRDQSTTELRALTGRTKVWTELVNEPRSNFTQWFGNGLGNKSFDGKPIDSTWLAIYHEQGFIGILLIAGILLFVLLAAGFSRAGPARALAFFVAVYCLCASYTEVGLGDATPYLLHIVVATSLVAAGAIRTDHTDEALETTELPNP